MPASEVTIRARELRKNMTPAEQALWRLLKERPAGLRFRRQHPIKPYYIDFYCPAIKLAIEVDGYSHERQVDYDLRRDEFLASQGITVLRVGNHAARYDPGSVIEEILKLVDSANP